MAPLMTRPKLKLTATHTTDCSCPVSTATGVTESTVVEEERTVSHMLNKDIIGAITCTQDTDLPRTLVMSFMVGQTLLPRNHEYL